MEQRHASFVRSSGAFLGPRRCRGHPPLCGPRRRLRATRRGHPAPLDRDHVSPQDPGLPSPLFQTRKRCGGLHPPEACQHIALNSRSPAILPTAGPQWQFPGGKPAGRIAGRIGGSLEKIRRTRRACSPEPSWKFTRVVRSVMFREHARSLSPVPPKPGCGEPASETLNASSSGQAPPWRQRPARLRDQGHQADRWPEARHLGFAPPPVRSPPCAHLPCVCSDFPRGGRSMVVPIVPQRLVLKLCRSRPDGIVSRLHALSFIAHLRREKEPGLA